MAGMSLNFFIPECDPDAVIDSLVINTTGIWRLVVDNKYFTELIVKYAKAVHDAGLA